MFSWVLEIPDFFDGNVDAGSEPTCEKKIDYPPPTPWDKGQPVQISKITMNYDPRVCEFWVCTFKYPRPFCI